MLSAPAVLVDRVGRGQALFVAAVLTLGGVLIALAPTVGVVRPYDGSAVGSWAAAGWAAVLPGLLAVILTIKPAAGLAATAGGGVLGLARILVDLSVITDPAAVARPELFVETTSSAEPFSVEFGAYLLVVGDLLMFAAGVLAAVWLSRAISFPDTAAESTRDGFGRPARPAGDGSGELLGASAELGAAQESDLDARAPLAAVLPTRRRRRNNAMLFAGFAGIVVLLAGSLPTAYQGGFLSSRFVPVGGDVVGTLGVLLAAATVAVVVLCAVLLPRRLAVPLLAGSAVTAAVPSLVAVLAVLSGAPAALTGSVWFTLAGAAVVAASGLLTRVRVSSAPGGDEWRPRSRLLRLVGAGLGVLAAGLSVIAAVSPNLLIDGRAEVVPAGTVGQNDPLPLLFVGAAVILAIGSVLTAVPATARAGRPVLIVAVAGVVLAVTNALTVLNTLVSASRNVAGLGIGVPVHPWTAGPGLWCGVGAALLAAAAAIVARLDDRSDYDSVLTVADDDSLADSRRARGWIAAAAAVLAVVALALPVYRTPLGDSATLLFGFSVNTWGVWVLLAMVVVALVAAALDRRPAVAAAFPLAAAAVCALRAVVPAAVRADPSYRAGAGLPATWALVVVLCVAAVAMMMLSRRVRQAAPPPAIAAPKAATPSPARRPARPAAKGKRS